jgi:uncharacterized protein with NRDE domain
MCTLIVGRDVLGPGSLLVGANRDEDPERSAEPPLKLSTTPLIVGGRDSRAGGTWLAIRDARAVVAVLNRRGARPKAPEALRSRGLLALEVAAAAPGGYDGDFEERALDAAKTALAANAYAPFSLVCATPEGGWVLAHDGTRTLEPQPIEPGWHVLTHGDLDDPNEPRTVRLKRKLDGFAARTTGEAETHILQLLSLHGTFGDGAPPEPGASETEPGLADADRAAVCIHSGRMVTVSASLFRIASAGARYIHIEGRPCTTPPHDVTALLTP